MSRRRKWAGRYGTASPRISRAWQVDPQPAGEAIEIGAAELVLRTPSRQFTDAQHPFDYCNTTITWLRTSESPYRPRALYCMAHFVNDAARANKLFSSVMEAECAGFDQRGGTPGDLLTADSTRRSSPMTSRARPRSRMRI